MKIAVLGSSAPCVAAAEYFHSIGASVCLFSNKQLSPLPFKVIRGRLVRVQKRFFDQSINERRLQDLFRLVYKTKAPALDPQIQEKLADTDLNHLKKSLESFEDVDLVIDGLGDIDFPKAMGSAGTLALNESDFFETDYVNYDLCDETTKAESVALVGNNEQCCKQLLLFSNLIKEAKLKVHHIFNSEKPFGDLADSPVKKDYKALMAELVKTYEERSENFQKDINEWKLKGGQKPQEPFFPLLFYPNYQVSSIDRLSDRDGIFLSLESDKNDELININVEKVYSHTGHAYNEFYLSSLKIERKQTISSEDGYYFLDSEDEIKVIEKNIMNFFSKG